MSIGYSKCLFLDRKHVFYPMSQEEMIIIISFLVQFRSTTKFSTALSYFFSAQIQTLKKWQHNRDDLFLANIFLLRVPIFSASFTVNCSYLKTWKYLILIQMKRKFDAYDVIFKFTNFPQNLDTFTISYETCLNSLDIPFLDKR